MTGPEESVRRLADWDAERLGRLAEQHETPTYVIDLDRVEANLDRLRAAFPDADVHYASKANAGSAVLSRLAAAGAGVECASAGEVGRALDAGFDGADLLYTPVNPPDRDLDDVIEYWTSNPGITITVDARDTIDRLADRGFTGRTAIRIHPGVGAGHSAEVSTGADAKFGVPVDAVPAVSRTAMKAGFEVVGLHAHVGSGILDGDIDAHRAVVETLAEVAESVPFDLEYVDVGGGFGVPYRPEETALDLDRIAEETRAALDAVDARLVIEPGRYLVADAGVLLTRVNTIKEPAARKPAGVDEPSTGVLAGVDAGMTDLLRPALYGSYHELRTLEPDADERARVPVTVVGPICESTDVFAEDRDLPRPVRGDVLAIGNAGAYGIEMASQYNSRPRPPVVAIASDEDTLVRRRETLADVTAMEVIE